MKKKIITTIAALCLSALPINALAAGGLSVTQKNVIIFDGKDSGYFYAKIENIGDSPIALKQGKLVLFSDKDEILCAEDYIDSMPNDIMLEAGEHVYTSKFLWDSALEGATIGDIKFSIETRDDGYRASKVDAEAVLDIKGKDSFENYVYVTLTNNTDEVEYDYYITAAITDNEGNILYVDGNSYNTLGLHSGSTVTLKMNVDYDLVSYYESHGLTPANVEVMAYCKNE